MKKINNPDSGSSRALPQFRCFHFGRIGLFSVKDIRETYFRTTTETGLCILASVNFKLLWVAQPL